VGAIFRSGLSGRDPGFAEVRAEIAFAVRQLHGRAAAKLLTPAGLVFVNGLTAAIDDLMDRHVAASVTAAADNRLDALVRRWERANPGTLAS